MTPTTTTTHALEHTSSGHPDGDYAHTIEDPSQSHHRTPTRKRRWQSNKKTKAKGHRSAHKPYKRWPKKPPAEHNSLLNRLSPQSPGTLLARIGLQVDEDEEAGSYGSTSDSEPHFHTPEPGEVERFLESVIGAPPEAPTNNVCLEIRPTLVFDTHNLDLEVPVKLEDQSISVFHSPPATAGIDQSFDQTLGGNTPDFMALVVSSATLEQCRKYLIPVVLASAKKQNSGTSLDSEQCAALLTDDRCKEFFRQAKEMRRQTEDPSMWTSQVNRLGKGSKRNGTNQDEDGSHNKRGRFNSTASDYVSRRDSGTTLVDFSIHSTPKAPRAILQYISHSQGLLKSGSTLGIMPLPQTTDGLMVNSLSAQDKLLDETTIAQPESATDREMTVNTSPSIPGLQRAEAEDLSSHLSGEPSAVGPTPSIPEPLTSPGVWFKQTGNGYPDVLDIEVHVSDDLFSRSGSSICMDVRLCCFRKTRPLDLGASPEALRAAIQGDALQWPKKGSLVVQVNPDSQSARTWLPYTLDSQSLNVSSCITPGTNTFRFIQLSDLSDFIFALVAFVPLPEDAWRSWDWTSTLRRSSSGDQPSSVLSEFSRIRFVTVQS